MRWGASTAADAARLEQDWLEQHTDTQGGVGSSRHAPEAASTACSEAVEAASEELTVNQQSQQQQHQHSRYNTLVSHDDWTSDPDSLPGAFVHGLAEVPTQSAQLRHANHTALESSASGIPVLLEDAAGLVSRAEQIGPALALDRQLQPHQLQTAPLHDAQLETPGLITGRQQQLHLLQIEAMLLCDSSCSPAAAETAINLSGEHAAPEHALKNMQQDTYNQPQQHHSQQDVPPVHSAAPRQISDSSKQPQVLRYRQRPGLQEGKRKGIRGILSFTQHPYRRVAPVATVPPVNTIGYDVRRSSMSFDNVTDNGLVLPAMAECASVSNSKATTAVKSTKYVKTGRPAVHVALQQCFQQIQACTLQLEEHNMQQQTMQKMLHVMVTQCGTMHDGMFKMQQQSHSR